MGDFVYGGTLFDTKHERDIAIACTYLTGNGYHTDEEAAASYEEDPEDCAAEIVEEWDLDWDEEYAQEMMQLAYEQLSGTSVSGR